MGNISSIITAKNGRCINMDIFNGLFNCYIVNEIKKKWIQQLGEYCAPIVIALFKIKIEVFSSIFYGSFSFVFAS